MKKIKLLPLMIIALGSLNGNSAYPITFGALGAYNITDAKLSQTVANTTFSSNTGYGGGLIMGTQFFKRLSGEIGLFYCQNKASYDLSGNFTGNGTTSWEALQIPLLMRFWLFKSFNIGAGGYIEHLIGSVKSTTNLTSPRQTTVTQSNVTSPTEGYGVVLSAQLQLPIWRKLQWIVDGRYEIGLTEFNGLASGSSAKSNHILLLSGVGLKF